MIRLAHHKFTRALLTLAVALLPIFSGISGGLHLLLVRHVVCRAHRELVHADETCAELTTTAQLATAADGSTAPQLEATRSGGALTDEHCLVGVVSRTNFVSWKIGAGSVLMLREFVTPAQGDRSAPQSSIAQILLAPKQSPPV